jgi:hypothetical protein
MLTVIYCPVMPLIASNVLVVGTLRPDLIESGSTIASTKADAIKTHHNDSDLVRELREQVRKVPGNKVPGNALSPAGERPLSFILQETQKPVPIFSSRVKSLNHSVISIKTKCGNLGYNWVYLRTSLVDIRSRAQV